eukprot:CAMPEP_0170552884 /NCGR_PEP_ID=MMETSP0211-20121228/10774_1 /TAXON_ID=311385 /ORGANISM="Pseudokeronopsis sp., Strain OXSARD2" /LENGTH=146 /DNA_ID=CAMNT_0010860921 /DNA_START=526 /DNA_END=966 /DNA_ORIENTATION=+
MAIEADEDEDDPEGKDDSQDVDNFILAVQSHNENDDSEEVLFYVPNVLWRDPLELTELVQVHKGHQDEGQTHEGAEVGKDDKFVVVPFTDAVVDVGAVVVEAFDAVVAVGAVAGEGGSDDEAAAAEPLGVDPQGVVLLFLQRRVII